MSSIDFSTAQFTTSAAKLADCPGDSLAEIAFAGRSNAGKSSAINQITASARLARTSKTPGRTQLINYFSLSSGLYLVDLPGYGFAKVPLAVRDKWQRELEQYLRRREVLTGLFLMSDIRHPLKEFDRMMLNWAEQSELPMHVLLTKSDKLKRGAARNTLLATQREFKDHPLFSFQLFSAVDGTGIKEARNTLEQWFKTAVDDADQIAEQNVPANSDR